MPYCIVEWQTGIKMYKPFPSDNRIGVSPEGVLFNYRTCKILKQHKNKQGYMNVVLTSPGVKHRAYRVHRVYATTYIKRPPHLQHIPFKQLEVNHKDGNKANNSRSNLEWVTGKGNIKHAIETGLTTCNNVVQSINLNTGEITTELSIRRMAEKHGIPLATLAKHLLSEMAGRHAYLNYAFRYASKEPWPPVSDRKRTWNLTIVVDKSTGEAHSFDTMAEASRFTGIKYNTINKALLVSLKPKWQNDRWEILLAA